MRSQLCLIAAKTRRASRTLSTDRPRVSAIVMKSRSAVEELLTSTQNIPQNLLLSAKYFYLSRIITYSSRIIFATCKQTSLFPCPPSPVITNLFCVLVAEVESLCKAFCILSSNSVRPVKRSLVARGTFQCTLPRTIPLVSETFTLAMNSGRN
jgi:hypothetical protein